MKLRFQQILLLPLLSFIIVITTNQICFAASQEADISTEQIHKILATADNVHIEIGSIECTGYPSCGELNTFATHLKPTQVLPLVQNMKLTKEKVSSWGSDTIPTVNFMFYKNEKRLPVYFIIGYGSRNFNYCYFPLNSKIASRGLDKTTIRNLRKLVLQIPEVVKKLKEVGIPIDLDPNHETP